MTNQAAGFTLIEVLVALVLLSIFSITTYRSLDAVLTAEQHGRQEMAHWQRLATAFDRMHSDLNQATGNVEARHGWTRGFVASTESSQGFQFERLLAEDQAGGLQRIGYRLNDGALIRTTWTENQPVSAPPNEAVLLEHVTTLTLRYLNDQGQWQTLWIPKGTAPLPKAVEVVLSLPDQPTLRRIFLVQ